VIDKDFSSAMMAANDQCRFICHQHCCGKSCPELQQTGSGFPDDNMTVAEAKQYIEEGHFAPGSMLPKIQAIIKSLKKAERKP
jgi:carbamate kinase